MSFRNGWLLLAAVFWTQSPAQAAPVPGQVQTFALSEVQLLDSPFKQNMERNAGFLLFLDPDRLLHNTRQYCGLEPKGALYGGWEARGVAGQTLGHYLTALSQQYAATGDKRFRRRIDYIVSEMAECQQRYGDGYIGALPPTELAALRALKQGDVRLKDAWVPWYTEHKVLAGLKDAWVLGGNAQARSVALKLADWVDAVTAGLTPAQQATMLRTEFGGMSETLVELYALTGNSRYLETSRRFYDHAVLDPLLAGHDDLPGKHANTQIPKIIGEARRYEVTGDASSRQIAEFFWGLVVDDYTWVIGGNSDREHFFPANAAGEHLGPETAETCNTYNMLKLTEHLMEWQPATKYGDYFERALYNQILPSQEPRHAMFTYFVSLKPGHFRTYCNPTNSFWCCMGTGMENHTKYGEAIYFHDADQLYVNLFIPSRLNWQAESLVLEQKTGYPDPAETELVFKSKPKANLTLKVRCPAWATGPLRFQLNDQPLAVESQPGQFAEVRHPWRKGDRLRITIPMGLRIESLAGAPDKVAILYGPLVLAGDFGPVPESKTYPNSADHTANDRAATAKVPFLVVADRAKLLASLQPVSGEALTFRTQGIGQPEEVTLRPFNSLPYNYYNVYWDVLQPAQWQQRQRELAAAAALRRADELRIVDELHPGEQQSETDHGLSSQQSETGDFGERKWRDARNGGSFTFRMKVLDSVPLNLRCTYWGDDAGGRTFDILVEGQRIATQTLDRNHPGEFFEVEYPIPAELLAGKTSVKVSFQAAANSMAGGLFGCATVKAPPKTGGL